MVYRGLQFIAIDEPKGDNPTGVPTFSGACVSHDQTSSNITELIMTQPQPVQPINYAPSTPPSGGRFWAAAVLAITGLGLIALGGCFLIGVLLLFYPSLTFGPTTIAVTSAPIWSWGTYLFCTVLSALAACCFVFGASLLWSTTRSLLRSVAAVHVESRQEAQ
jgi:hypothetical protein